jgi:hypothetical protein
MSTSSISTSTSAASLENLVKQLADRVDANKDGQITTDEFGSFLQTMLGATTGGSQEGSAISPLTLDSAPASGDAAEASPATWSDNNAPYGVTFAGFSPQDHRDLTLEDLGVPGKAEKYAVYSYLLANKVQPTSDWAPAVADALNRKYNTSVFHAIDGETLGYGNEYIHSAPNGYGMAAGTYNRNATGEFFWGWV